MIDFYNIYKQDRKLLKQINLDFNKIIKNNSFILGDWVNKFEKDFSKYIGCKFTVGCANGTDALLLALKSLNLPKNSEAIIPAMTYCSTLFSVIHAGLKPVLVDINLNDPLIDLNEVKKKINQKTSVIIPVHLYGSVVDIPKLRGIIKNFPNIKILDDCAQAHGAFYCGKCKLKNDLCCQKSTKVGNIADISTFSFYPGKNLGAYGDAGAITTNDKKIYSRLIKLRNLGSKIKFKHELVGYNSRLDNIQGMILSHKIKFLNFNNNKRIKIAKFYNSKIKKNYLLNYSKGSVYHQFAILFDNKKILKKLFKKNQIPFGEHYPQPLHKLDACKNFFKGLVFKNAENFAKKTISLPMDPSLSKKQIVKIVNLINET